VQAWDVDGHVLVDRARRVRQAWKRPGLPPGGWADEDRDERDAERGGHTRDGHAATLRTAVSSGQLPAAKAREGAQQAKRAGDGCTLGMSRETDLVPGVDGWWEAEMTAADGGTAGT
jgi:hypothetical protein